MIGIKDIAAKAGVSPSTVSNVLNGKKNVGEETRKRVQQLCDELGYKPNMIGKALKTGENRTIMFNFSDFDRQFYLDIIHGINDCIVAKDYNLIICTNKSCEKFMNRAFTSGCIMLDGQCTDQTMIQKASEDYPIVVLDRLIDLPYIKSVLVNSYVPQRALIEGLIEKGYRSFAYLAGLEGQDNKERYRALTDVLQEHQLSLRRDNYYVGDYREKSGYQAARLLMLKEQMPDVLVCANDSMAIGALKGFRKNNIRVPEDIAICGFDDIEMAKAYGLTTVSIPNYERGYLAAQYLIENIEGAQNYETFKISAKVKWRSTTR